MLEAVVNAFKIPDLRRKILFTLAMLVIFRFIASIPVPGVDRDGLKDFIENNQLLGVLNLFSGNGLSNFSIVALGVYPYITASIRSRADAETACTLTSTARLISPLPRILTGNSRPRIAPRAYNDSGVISPSRPSSSI